MHKICEEKPVEKRWKSGGKAVAPPTNASGKAIVGGNFLRIFPFRWENTPSDTRIVNIHLISCNFHDIAFGLLEKITVIRGI